MSFLIYLNSDQVKRYNWLKLQSEMMDLNFEVKSNLATDTPKFIGFQTVLLLAQ